VPAAVSMLVTGVFPEMMATGASVAESAGRAAGTAWAGRVREIKVTRVVMVDGEKCIAAVEVSDS